MPEATIASLEKYACLSVNSVKEENNEYVEANTSTEENEDNEMEFVGSTDSSP